MFCRIVVSWLLVTVTPGFAGGWPTKGHDNRRTGQSDVAGPRSAQHVELRRFADELAINIPVTVSSDGRAYFGTWGIVRSGGSDDRTEWNKSDGKVFAVDRRLEDLWDEPFPGDQVPYCYQYRSREFDPGFCPDGGTVNGYNGTVEGTGALSADQSVLYMGRGDGKLYAIDAATGVKLWSFSSFNPEDPNDPEGGGEIIAGPLVAADGAVYFLTAGAGEYETNAVYAVTPDGVLLWRYPHSERSFPNSFIAAPALSPDGSTLYVGGAWGPTIDDWDHSVPGSVLAFDLDRASGTGNERLKWRLDPVNQWVWWKPTVWTTTLAVGSDGTIYCAGPEYTLGGASAVIFAIRDADDHPEYVWNRMVDLDINKATISLGVALRETDGTTTRVYASSGNPFITLLGYKAGGKLYALDPQTGASIWSKPFDPAEHGGFGSMGGVAIDRDGVVYAGVSGGLEAGRVFALSEEGSLLWTLPTDGLQEWGHPVLGPDGSLWFSDNRRCAFNYLPVELGTCANVPIDPGLYVVHTGPERRRGVRRKNE